MIKLSQKQVDVLNDFCMEHDYRFYLNYSGRCMYGKKCIGFVVSQNFLVKLGFNLAIYLQENEEDELMDYFKDYADARTDSMCMDIIVYFPSIGTEEGVTSQMEEEYEENYD
jgi:hypothetical protein